MDNNVVYAFLLTLFAGLSISIGSLIPFFVKKTSKAFLAISLGFSAGVMIYVSMIEIISESFELLTTELGERTGSWLTVAAFFGGMLLMILIERLIPFARHSHDTDCGHTYDPLDDNGIISDEHKQRFMRMGLLTALGIVIHNFPEGLATFVTALQDPALAIPIVFAVCIHNIPLGIAVSVPIYYATGSKNKSFLYTFLAGLSEPLGALIGYLLLRPYMNDVVFGVLFASVAGIMIYVSFDELLPAALEHGEHHLSIYGLIAGMLVMAVSLLLFI